MRGEELFERIRAQMLSAVTVDSAFDGLLPPLARAKSRQYWSPLCVAHRAAPRFHERGVKRVLDVGAGPGKFCIAAGFASPNVEYCGVEQRVALVEAARHLATSLQLKNVEFRLGNVLQVPWSEFDGFFFYNPLVENVFGADLAFDETVELSGSRFGGELLKIVELLSSVRVGSVVVTYCGLGGPIPSSYELRLEETVGAGRLRTWIKSRAYEANWYYLDHHKDVGRAPRRYIERKLRHLEVPFCLP